MRPYHMRAYLSAADWGLAEKTAAAARRRCEIHRKNTHCSMTTKPAKMVKTGCEPAFRSRCLLIAQVSLCHHPWLTSNLLIRPVAESMSQRPFLMVPAMDPYCHPTLYVDLVDVLVRNTA